MHRALVRLLLPAIAASLAFPSFLAADPPGPLRVATFCCDVTPPVDGHPLIWVVPVKEVETPLLAKGIVLDDGHQRYVLCSLDWCGLCNSSHDLFRDKIAAAAGVDAKHVAVHSIHQHTAPYTDGDAQRLIDQFDDLPLYVDFEFLDQVTDRLGEAVAKAEFQPFDHVGVGQAKVDRVASSRRLPIEGGKVRSRMSSCTDPELIAMPEGVIDPMLKTITFARGDKPLVRMHYYATHPQSFYGDPRASYDVPGFARERLQEKEGVFQIYFTGCSGDVAMGKYNDRTPRARDELTDRLYAGMEASVASTRLVPCERIQWRTLPVVLPARDDPGYTVEENRAKMADPKVDTRYRIRAATRVAYAERAERPIDLSLLAIGDVYALHLPGESMVEFQLFAQGVKPDAFVAVAAYGDVGPGYICTERSFSEGGYEPTASRVAPNSEHLFKAAIRELLEARSIVPTLCVGTRLPRRFASQIRAQSVPEIRSDAKRRNDGKEEGGGEGLLSFPRFRSFPRFAWERDCRDALRRRSGRRASPKSVPTRSVGTMKAHGHDPDTDTKGRWLCWREFSPPPC